MTGNIVCIFLLALTIGCRPYSVQGFECRIATEPIIITGDTIYSVNFTWECTLMSNESIPSMVWYKEDICIATASNGTFKPCENYTGRVELFERYGISINNISSKDSGHYRVAFVFEGNIKVYKPCQSTYLLVLPEHRPVFKEATALPFAKGKQSSECVQHGPSKLVIGLICGILPLTVINGIGGVVWYFRRKRHNGNHVENEKMSPELFPLQILG